MTRPVVLQSLEDETGARCVDIIRLNDGAFTWRECRRDPEDGHGWRHLSESYDVLLSKDAALQAAFDAVEWLS